MCTYIPSGSHYDDCHESSMIEWVTGDSHAHSTQYMDALANTQTGEAERWNRESTRDSEDKCWKPFQEFVVLDTYGTWFSSLRLGVYGDYETVNQDDTIDYNTAWISIAVKDGTQSAYEDVGWQYWTVDLTNDFLEERRKTHQDNANAVWWDIPPAYWRRDVDAEPTALRLTELMAGNPEYYDESVTVEYKGSDTEQYYTTWMSVATRSNAADDGTF